MTTNMESMYWKTNKEWYYFDDEADDFKLTEKAPERAIKSYALYNRRGNKDNTNKQKAV